MSASIEQQVQNAVESLFAAISARDLDAAVAHYAPQDNIICLGPAADDVSVGVQSVYNTLNRQFAQSHDIQCQYVHASANYKGAVAWTVGQVSMTWVTAQGTSTIQGRYTSVLEYDKDHERWLIRHNLFSVPSQQSSLAGLFPSDLSNPQAPPPKPQAQAPSTIPSAKPPPPPV